MLKLVVATAALILTLISPVSARGCAHSWHCWSGDYRQHVRHIRHVRHAYYKHHRKAHRKVHRAKRRTIPVIDPNIVVAAKDMPHPAGCPSRAFCGCGTALYVFKKNIRELWLASNWFRFPRTEAAPGMVAVRNHHVFAIVKVIRPGLALAYDPNSGGHRTRIHPRRLAGFVVVDPHGLKRYAAL